jgi:hypothetical protein
MVIIFNYKIMKMIIVVNNYLFPLFSIQRLPPGEDFDRVKGNSITYQQIEVRCGRVRLAEKRGGRGKTERPRRRSSGRTPRTARAGVPVNNGRPVMKGTAFRGALFTVCFQVSKSNEDSVCTHCFFYISTYSVMEEIHSEHDGCT